MRPSDTIACPDMPCEEVDHSGFQIPGIDVDPYAVRMVIISEAAAADPADDYYAAGEPMFLQTTLEAFRLAGAEVSSLQDLFAMGVYLTTAIKCAKVGYTIKAAPIKACSHLLEQELALFPNTRMLMLMGDVAIKAVNYVAKRNGEPRVIPAGSTYKIRGRLYHWRGMRVFPSYLQSGKAFFIEASKRRMIAEDLKQALALLTDPCAGSQGEP